MYALVTDLERQEITFENIEDAVAHAKRTLERDARWEIRDEDETVVYKKCWFLIDDCTGSKSQEFTEELKSADKDEAIRDALDEWEQLSPHDRALRDDFYVCLAEYDIDNGIIFDTAREVYSIKQDR